MLNKRNLLIPAAAALMALTSLPGCFTGIESTPRITQADVDRRNSHSKTPEQMLLSEVRAEPFAAWTHGKKLYVTDSRIAVALTPSSAAAELTEGSVLDYRGMNPSLTVMGDSVADLCF